MPGAARALLEFLLPEDSIGCDRQTNKPGQKLMNASGKSKISLKEHFYVIRGPTDI